MGRAMDGEDFDVGHRTWPLLVEIWLAPLFFSYSPFRLSNALWILSHREEGLRLLIQ